MATNFRSATSAAAKLPTIYALRFACLAVFGLLPAAGVAQSANAHVAQGDLTGAVISVQVPQAADGAGRTISEQVFKGIPYAQPPVGPLRWKPPVPAASWSSPRAAAEFGASCMQPPADWMSMSTQPSEDCLTLNIWAPQTAGAKPVFVWIHGGAFISGGSAEPKFDGATLAAQGMVVVTLNYRLGVFGWMAHPQLTAESAEHTSGNYGLLDQIAALQWVKQNIAAFGGDATRVTIAGESAGGASVGYLLATPRAAGLFQRAILESPTGLFTAPIFRVASMNPPPEKNTNKPAEMTNGAALRGSDPAPIEATRAMPKLVVPAGAGPLTAGAAGAQNPAYTAAEDIGLAVGPDIAELRALSAADLMARAAKNTAALFSHERDPRGEYSGKGMLPLSAGSWIHTGEERSGWQIIIDGAVVPAPIGTAIKTGCGVNVPILAGTNADEGTLFARNLQIKSESDYRHYLTDYFAPVFSGIRGAYGGETDAEWKESIAALVRDAFFQYGVNRLAAAETQRGSKVFLYEFSRTTKTSRADKTMAFHGAELPYVFGTLHGPDFDETDRKLSVAMQQAWARFAATGDPNPGNIDGPKTPEDISSTGQALLWPVYSTNYPREMGLDTGLMDHYVLNTVVFATFDRNYRRYQTTVPAPVCSAVSAK